MKKNFLFVLLAICFVSLSSFTIENTNKVKDQQDKIIFSREGGTTRSTTEIIIDATADRNNVTIQVMNYRGGVWMQLTGGRTAWQSYFEVYDMGFEVINISSLRAGTYTIRLMFDGETYVGTFTKPNYGR